MYCESVTVLLSDRVVECMVSVGRMYLKSGSELPD